MLFVRSHGTANQAILQADLGPAASCARPQRIVHVITRLVLGGAEENTVATCLHQADSGHRVTLIHGPGAAPVWASRVGVRVELLGMESLVHPISPLADLAEMTKQWAVERYVGHWDSYSGWDDSAFGGLYSPNNYFLHSDASGRFSMLPWGADQTWATFLFPFGFDDGQAIMFTSCLADAACAALYRDAVDLAATTFDGLDLDPFADTTAAMLRPVAGARPPAGGNTRRHRRGHGARLQASGGTPPDHRPRWPRRAPLHRRDAAVLLQVRHRLVDHPRRRVDGVLLRRGAQNLRGSSQRLVIDLDTCVGCQACATSCKEWNTSGEAGPLDLVADSAASLDPSPGANAKPRGSASRTSTSATSA